MENEPFLVTSLQTCVFTSNKSIFTSVILPDVILIKLLLSVCLSLSVLYTKSAVPGVTEQMNKQIFALPVYNIEKIKHQYVCS